MHTYVHIIFLQRKGKKNIIQLFFQHESLYRMRKMEKTFLLKNSIHTLKMGLFINFFCLWNFFQIKKNYVYKKKPFWRRSDSWLRKIRSSGFLQSISLDEEDTELVVIYSIFPLIPSFSIHFLSFLPIFYSFFLQFFFISFTTYFQ